MTDNPACGPTQSSYKEDISEDLHEHFLHWTGDGSSLVFDLDDTIWTFDIEGALLKEIADVDPDFHRQPDGRPNGYRFQYGFYADVSPDGSRIVYANCEHKFHNSIYNISAYGYEIGTMNIEGTGYSRLTDNAYLDNFPVWSPKGSEIAFVRHKGDALHSPYYPIGGEDQSLVKLAVMAVETGETRLLEYTSGVALYPPVWSPDGEYLAYIAGEKSDYPNYRVLNTVQPEWWKKPTRIGETTALPTWSPDGKRLAVAAVDGDESVVYTTSPEGDDRWVIWRGGSDSTATPVSQVSWSPDGSEILVGCGPDLRRERGRQRAARPGGPRQAGQSCRLVAGRVVDRGLQSR